MNPQPHPLSLTLDQSSHPGWGSTLHQAVTEVQVRESPGVAISRSAYLYMQTSKYCRASYTSRPMHTRGTTTPVC